MYFGIRCLLRLNRAGRGQDIWGKEHEVRQTLSQAELYTGTDTGITGLDEEVWKGPATVKTKRLLRCLLISTHINDLTQLIRTDASFLRKPSDTFPFTTKGKITGSLTEKFKEIAEVQENLFIQLQSHKEETHKYKLVGSLRESSAEKERLSKGTQKS